MNDVYKRNLEALKKRHYLEDENEKEIIDALVNGQSSIPSSYEIQLETDLQGQKIISLNKDSYSYALSSRVDAEGSSKIYSERYNNPEPFETYILFGMGDGRVARNILTDMLDNVLLVAIEPDVNVLLSVMSEFDISDIISNENFFLLIGKAKLYEELQNLLEGVINPGTVAPIRFLIAPGYDILYSDMCKSCITMADYVMDAIRINSNTLIKMTDEINLNTFKNMKYLIDGSDLYWITNEFNKADISNIPAILVSAGPSLDKNIDDLKKAEGRAFILAVDSAVRALENHNINYNAVITGDAEKEYSVFEDERTRRKPLIAEISSNYEIIQNWKGRIFFNGAAMGFTVQKSILDGVLTHNLGEVETGGSISTNAFSALMGIGFKTIVLVGQDLAFTGGKGHVEGYSNQETEEELKERGIEQVEGWDGTMLTTDAQMRYYVRWFEKKIEAVKNYITVIDATEGGAKIQGAINMTLRDAIDKYCHDERDFDDLLNNAPYLFEGEDKDKCIDHLRKLPDRLKDFGDKLTKYKDAYVKMRGFIQKGIVSGSDFDKTYKIVKEANAIDRTEDLYQLVSSFCLREVYKYKNTVMDKNKPMEEVLTASARLMDDCNAAIDKIIKLIKKEWNYL